ncbi:hypothetical protein BGZ65_003250 [Modicella reniformis]|uniref:Uncharacterized protein n=1 Tax=Modicella reniformis TaxID=1440133 RepID=A0A9P6INJ1_9FUNG|nr:hypothetical protein BGZ65_003250 [Modicella reniformis]
MTSVTAPKASKLKSPYHSRGKATKASKTAAPADDIDIFNYNEDDSLPENLRLPEGSTKDTNGDDEATNNEGSDHSDENGSSTSSDEDHSDTDLSVYDDELPTNDNDDGSHRSEDSVKESDTPEPAHRRKSSLLSEQAEQLDEARVRKRNAAVAWQQRPHDRSLREYAKVELQEFKPKPVKPMDPAFPANTLPTNVGSRTTRVDLKTLTQWDLLVHRVGQESFGLRGNRPPLQADPEAECPSHNKAPSPSVATVDKVESNPTSAGRSATGKFVLKKISLTPRRLKSRRKVDYVSSRILRVDCSQPTLPASSTDQFVFDVDKQADVQEPVAQKLKVSKVTKDTTDLGT